MTAAPQATDVAMADAEPDCAAATPATSVRQPAADATIPRRALARTGNLLFVLRLRLEFGDLLLRGNQVLALFEFLDETFEQRQGERLLLRLRVRFRQVVIDGIACGERRVLREDVLEANDGARVPLRAVVVVADEIVGRVEPVLRLAQLRPRLRRQPAVGITIDECLELADGIARLGLVALRRAHLLVVADPQLVLLVI